MVSFPIFPDDPGMILKHWKNEILRVILRGRHSFCVVVVFVCLFFLFDTFEKKNTLFFNILPKNHYYTTQ